MIEFKKTVINARGFSFNALQGGPVDGELVLFLHGFPQFADAWHDVMCPIAEAGYHTLAVDQRGYSPAARPGNVSDYALDQLISDIEGFVDAFGQRHFHLVGHDWGAFLAWVFTARNTDRVQSLTALSTPHPDAFLNAIETDEDQKQRSKYISLFRMPGGAAERLFEANHYQLLRSVYQGKVPESAISENIRRLAEPGALTAALNWYRALKLETRIGSVIAPTLYIWSTQDLALGETAARNTAHYVSGHYRFEKFEGESHWLLEEVPKEVSRLLLDHLNHHGK